MRKISISLALAVAALALCLPNGQAFAQATRTWVSGVGDDANPCSRTAPCKTWAGAISKTASGGEIDALDPGGFGGLTITKSITLDGGGGQVASTLVAGVNGINVVATSTDVIIIRNVRFDGILGNGSNAANAGVNGIKFTAGGVLIIENAEIFGFAQSGIDIEPTNSAKVLVTNTQIQNCGAGNVNTAGILIKPGAGASVNVTVERTVVQSCANGIRMDQGGGGAASNLVVNKSVFAGSNANGIIVTSAGATFTGVVTDTTLASNIGAGAAVSGSGGKLFLGNTTITENVNGVSNSGGTLQSFKNNQIVGNLNDGTPITAVSSGGFTLN